MTDQEYRALVEGGPAVVMVAKADMLRMLDWAEFGRQASLTLRTVRIRLMNGEQTAAMDHLKRRIAKVPAL
jgi:hypothetical protein